MAQAVDSKKRGKPKDKLVDRDALLKAYRIMLLIRRFEERAGQLYGMGLIGRFLPSLHRSGSGRRRHADGAQ